MPLRLLAQEAPAAKSREGRRQQQRPLFGLRLADSFRQEASWALHREASRTRKEQDKSAAAIRRAPAPAPVEDDMPGAPAQELGPKKGPTRSQPVIATRPRAAVRRYVLMKLGMLAALLALLGVAYLVYARQVAARRWRQAEQRLRTAVPAFSRCALRPVTSEADLQAAELSDADGVLATVVLRADDRLYVSFLMPGLPYRPATDAQVRRWLDEKPPDDPQELRMVKHGLGALRPLWPNLPAGSIHVDKIEAVSKTARQATLLLSLPTEAGRLGVAEEVDLYQYKLLAVELRFGL